MIPMFLSEQNRQTRLLIRAAPDKGRFVLTCKGLVSAALLRAPIPTSEKYYPFPFRYIFALPQLPGLVKIIHQGYLIKSRAKIVVVCEILRNDASLDFSKEKPAAS